MSVNKILSYCFEMQAPPVAQNKQIYILKKTVIPINAENYRELLLFGFLSPSPLLQLSSTIEQVIVISSTCYMLLCRLLARFHEFWVNSLCASSQGVRSTAVKQQKPSDVAKSDV